MPSAFLTGKKLTAKIVETMSGKKPCMCVAFLGPDWTRHIFAGKPPKNLKVICDLEMGVTSRQALEELNAPNNKNLRYLPKQEMHAKVYLSNLGAVVCSANASTGGLAKSERIEDGVWITADEAAYLDIKENFLARFEKSKKIDRKALNSTPIFASRGSGSIDAKGHCTLLKLLRTDPSAFKGIRFVFSNETVHKELKDNAWKQVEYVTNAGEVPVISIPSRQRSDFFAGWKVSESEWPALFLSIHRKRNGKFVISKNRHFHYCPKVATTDDEASVDVFVSQIVHWTTVGAAFGDLPQFATIGSCEQELSEHFPTSKSFEKLAGKVMTAEQFADQFSEGLHL